MKNEIKLDDNLDSPIVKVVTLDKDKYEVYFKFLSIPVQVNEDYLGTILEDQIPTDQLRASA